MKVQRVYVDTSVIGGCFDREFAPWSRGLIKDFVLGNYKPVLSAVLALEIVNAPARVQQIYADLLMLAHDLIDITEEAIALADAYQEREVVTPKYYADGLHIALATVSETDVLVSWNFKHIVHFDKIRLFNAVNLERGYRSLQIYSPREVTNYEEREGF